jgi:hypothetical protein
MSLLLVLDIQSDIQGELGKALRAAHHSSDTGETPQ